MKNGYLKVELADLKIKVGNIDFNKNAILDILDKSESGLILFPELSLTGYTASDLFFFKGLLDEVSSSLTGILHETTYKGLFILGAPFEISGVLYNCAFVCKNKKVLGIVPKRYLPNTHEFYEKRYFNSYPLANKTINVRFDGYDVPFGNIIFKDETHDVSIGVEICQDMWAVYTPSDDLSLSGANVLCNLSASPETVLKHNIRRTCVLDHSRKQNGCYLYTSSNFSESSSDVVFSGHKMVSVLGDMISETIPFSDTGSLVADIDIDMINYSRRMDSTYRDQFLSSRYDYVTVNFKFTEESDFRFEKKIDTLPFIKSDNSYYDEIMTILVHGLSKKLLSVGKEIRKIVIGISGGLDSCLALLIAYKTFKNLNLPLKNIICVSMPSDVTHEQSRLRASKLIDSLKGVTKLEIPINDEVNVHLKSIDHKTEDTTYENAQARIRTLILMDLANKYKGFVLGTGDLSEIALGFMTYNGDQMSMYAINSGVPKTVLRGLVSYFSEHEFKSMKGILNEIIDTKVTPELLKNQSTEDFIGLYEINDFILYHHLVNGASDKKITWLVKNAFSLDDKESFEYTDRFFKRFYQNQFKRTTMPDGPKVFSVSLSPRGDFRLPSDIEIK